MDAHSMKEFLNQHPKRLVGMREVLRAAGEGTVRCVILALDADAAVRDRVTEACLGKNVEIIHVPSKAELGSLVGIDVHAAVVGIL